MSESTTSLPIPLVYIAGPYRAATGWAIERNIQRARAVGALVVSAGGYPVIPHSNTSHFDGLAPDELFLAGTLTLLDRCDAIVALNGWQESKGTKAELARAKVKHLQILVLPSSQAEAERLIWKFVERVVKQMSVGA